MDQELLREGELSVTIPSSNEHEQAQIACRECQDALVRSPAQE